MPDPQGLERVKNLIIRYYRKNQVNAPDRVGEREFGVGTFERKIANRHMSFKNAMDLNKYLSREGPPYVSYSNSYYDNPDWRPMEKKGWKGAELVFDLDVTDMDLKCQKVHGKGWICKECLASVREETLKLVEEFLVPDFGFDKGKIKVNFSGNRGYHVHVNEESVISLTGRERKEITDYIAGIGMEMNEFFPTLGMKGKSLIGPKPSDRGWRRRMATQFIASLNAGPEALQDLGIDDKMARMLYKKRALIQMGINNGNWDMVYIKNKADFWRKILENQTIKQSDKIDRNVTNDVSHLIRLPGTIHGETGLVAKELNSASELADYDPMTKAIAFGEGYFKIKVKTDFPLFMNGMKFGPYAESVQSLPIYAAVYLYLKGFATIIDTTG